MKSLRRYRMPVYLVAMLVVSGVWAAAVSGGCSTFRETRDAEGNVTGSETTTLEVDVGTLVTVAALLEDTLGTLMERAAEIAGDDGLSPEQRAEELAIIQLRRNALERTLQIIMDRVEEAVGAE